MIQHNSTYFRRFLCNCIGYHPWRIVARWRQESTDTRLRFEWDDYICPYCGKWECGVDREVGWHGFEIWSRIQRQDLPPQPIKELNRIYHANAIHQFPHDELPGECDEQ